MSPTLAKILTRTLRGFSFSDKKRLQNEWIVPNNTFQKSWKAGKTCPLTPYPNLRMRLALIWFMTSRQPIQPWWLRKSLYNDWCPITKKDVFDEQRRITGARAWFHVAAPRLHRRVIWCDNFTPDLKVRGYLTSRLPDGLLSNERWVMSNEIWDVSWLASFMHFCTVSLLPLMWQIKKLTIHCSRLIAQNVEGLFSCTSGLTTASPDSCSNLNVSSIKCSNELSLGNPIFWRKR